MALRGKGVPRGCVNPLDTALYCWKGEQNERNVGLCVEG